MLRRAEAQSYAVAEMGVQAVGQGMRDWWVIGYRVLRQEVDGGSEKVEARCLVVLRPQNGLVAAAVHFFLLFVLFISSVLFFR